MKIRKIDLNTDKEKIMLLGLEEKQKILRQLREKECFSLVNRGQVWYDLLNDEQKAELKVWYQAWLDVTKTFYIPEKPNWI